MSWLSELSIVYDKVYRNEDFADSDKLMPLYHTINNASITVILNENSECERIVLLEKGEATIMPCTESCSSRSSGADAYPLCDKLEYVCKGFNEKNFEKFKKYSSLLSSWANSDFSVDKVRIVHNYIEKGTLLKDLSDNDIKPDDVSGFVRFSVHIKDDLCPDLWEDFEVKQSWISYYNSAEFDNYCKKNYLKSDELSKRLKKIDMDYVNGDKEKIATYHPSKIRNSGDAAKLISANDGSNFTYRGRFVTADEACQISSNTSQRAHSALKWLLQRQGKSIGDGMSVVLWNRAGDRLPTLMESSSDMVSNDEEDDDEVQYVTSDVFSLSFINKIKGIFKKSDSDSTNIMIMIIKETSPGKGRVSVAFYRELQESEVENAIDSWYKKLFWYHSYKNDKKELVSRVGTPSLEEIVKCAFGDEVERPIMEMEVQRLYLCIIDRKPIPRDLEELCFRRALNPVAIDSNVKREMFLEIACAVYKYNHYKEDYKLSLEKERKTRGYLFGRLWAVAHQYENAYLRYSKIKRDTNAVRYMKQFSLHPAKTWKMLEVEKIAVFRKSMNGLSNWFDQLLDEIFDLFDASDFNCDKPLDAEFLLGYHCQLKELRNIKEENKNSDEEN